MIDRLERIEVLEREGAPPAVMLEELRGLVREAETWVRVEGDERARAAVDRCDSALARPALSFASRGLAPAAANSPQTCYKV